MEKTSIYKFYRLGQILNQFSTDEKPNNIDLYNRITNFLDFVSELNLQVTNSAITLGDLKKYHKILDAEIKSKPKEKTSSEIVKNVSFEVKKLITTFEAEILNINSFILDEKKFKLDYLIDSPTYLFKNEDVLLIAPYNVQYNVFESAKCLAFDTYSASAFHMLLATEEYVRFFNDKFIEYSHDNEIEPTFFNLINETDSILKDLNYNSELISLLHIIRKYYRNQSQHSNRKFTEIEASDLFNICIKVMNEMYTVLEVTLPDNGYE